MNRVFIEFLNSYPSMQAPVWCAGGHLQTLAGHLLPQEKLREGFVQRNIVTQDGDTLVSFLYKGRSEKIIALFHGLAGSTNSGYMIRLGNLFSFQGHSVLLVNHRGAHPDFPLAKEIYHSGRSEDMSAVFSWVRKEFSDLYLIAMGFSMSANILLLNLAGVRSEHQPDFAVAANAPLNLGDACRLLDTGVNRIYGLYFTKEL
ncbi:MAG: alpha/beta fold hydrolase, partial [Pseudobdellovibrionaceae bacterium]